MLKNSNIQSRNKYNVIYNNIKKKKNNLRKIINKELNNYYVKKKNNNKDIQLLKDILDKYINNIDLYQLNNVCYIDFIKHILTNLQNQFNIFYIHLLTKATESGYDYLTNILNRRTGEARLNDIHNESINRNKTYTLFMIDIDNFKLINDKFGHVIGDGVLKFVAQKLKQSCRSEDIVCRYGGEEFMVACPNLTYKQAIKKASEINKIINNNKIDTNGYTELEKYIYKFIKNRIDISSITNIPKTISVSIGSKTFVGITDRDLYKTYNDIILLADKALYISKKRGRNCFTTIETTSNIDPSIELINKINKLYINDIKKILLKKYPINKIKNITLSNIDIKLIDDIKILEDLRHILRKIIKENKDKFLHEFIGSILDNIIKRIGEISIFNIVKKQYPNIKIKI